MLVGIESRREIEVPLSSSLSSSCAKALNSLGLRLTSNVSTAREEPVEDEDEEVAGPSACGSCYSPVTNVQFSATAEFAAESNGRCSEQSPTNLAEGHISSSAPWSPCLLRAMCTVTSNLIVA